MNLGRDEAELTERLDERRRAADEAAQWERIQAVYGARGWLGEFESNLRDLRRYRIRWERKRGISLRAARLRADDLIERVKKNLIAFSPVGRGDSVESESPAGD